MKKVLGITSIVLIVMSVVAEFYSAATMIIASVDLLNSVITIYALVDIARSVTTVLIVGAVLFITSAILFIISKVKFKN